MKALLLAWRNVLRNRRRSFVTILIAAVGTSSVLVGGGFAIYTYGMLIDVSAREFGHLTVAAKDYFERDEETPMQYGLAASPALSARLAGDPRVRHVLPRISLSGLVSNGEKSMIFVGTGVDIRTEAQIRGPFLTVVEGGLGDERRDTPQVLLGTDLARSLNAHPGSGLTLLATTSAGVMNAIDVEVAGVVGTGWRDLDKRLVYISLKSAQHLLMTDKVSVLSVYLEDTDMTPAALTDIATGDPDHAYKPWWEQAFYYFAVRGLYDRIFGLLGFIIGALVFFSVANTLAMAVVERTREIGTLRALGAHPGEIVGQFVREGLLIGVAGTFIGTLIGLAVVQALPFLGLEMPPPPGRSVGYPLLVSYSLPLYVAANAVIVLLCVGAAWFVSRKAAQKPIVEALGHV